MTLCECGCGRPTNVVKGVPMRFIRGHNPGRLARRYRVDETTGCWVWLGVLNHGGYGQTSQQLNGTRRRLRAHRAFYERLVGPIPAGMQIDHLCRNRACVNPEHMEVVTSAENTRRGRATKLTKEAVAEIRSGNESALVLAKRYGVQPGAISKVRVGLNWRDCDVSEASLADVA